jgi:hypothetical protein
MQIFRLFLSVFAVVYLKGSVGLICGLDSTRQPLRDLAKLLAL